MSRYRYSRDGKVEAIKEFMQQLYEKGIIIRTKKNRRQFEFYCKWAGGHFIRFRLDRKRVVVACVNPALVHHLDRIELIRRIISMYISMQEEELLHQQQYLEYDYI